jgi:DNA-binding NarL/FixJ family response regulator
MRILILNNGEQTGENWKTLLEKFSQDIWEAAFNQQQIEALWLKRQPNVVIADLSLETYLSATAWIRDLKSRYAFRVVYICKDLQVELLDQAWSTQPDNVLIHPVTEPQLMATLHLIRLGQQEENKKSGANQLDVLSKREREVWEWIRKGLTSKEIAMQLFVSINTVNTHKRRIREKLGVRRFVEVG